MPTEQIMPTIVQAAYTASLRKWLNRQDHYLGNAPPGCMICVVVQSGLRLQGILLVGRPTAPKLPQDGSWGEITRLWLEPGLPHGTASAVIRFVIELCRKRGMKRLISYHDRTRHTGCIYRKAGMRKDGITLSPAHGWASRPSRELPLFGITERRKSGYLVATPKRRWAIDL